MWAIVITHRVHGGEVLLYASISVHKLFSISD